MGWEFYVFAAFLFAMFALLILMLVRGLRKNSAGDRLEQLEREDRVLELYAKMDEMMEATEAYVEESRAEMETALGRARELCAQMEGMVKGMEERCTAEVPPAEKEEPELQDESVKKDEMKEKVRELYAAGEQVEEIARELGYSKGEIAFMLRLTAQEDTRKQMPAAGKKRPGKPRKSGASSENAK